jgi:hypothetical protein
MPVARRLRAVLLDLAALVSGPRRVALDAQMRLLDAAVARAYAEGTEREHAMTPIARASAAPAGASRPQSLSHRPRTSRPCSIRRSPYSRWRHERPMSQSGGTRSRRRRRQLTHRKGYRVDTGEGRLGFVETVLRSENPRHDIHKSDLLRNRRQPLLAGRDGLTHSQVGSSVPRGMRVRVHRALDANEAVYPPHPRPTTLAFLHRNRGRRRESTNWAASAG